MTPQEFIAKWGKAELSERAAAQSHFIDLCRLMEHPTPTDADQTGGEFTFEKGLTKTGGGGGFADVWKRGFFAWEYKKKGRNLDAALEQLSRYAAALENPPLHIASDMDRIVIVTAWTNSVPERHEIPLAAIAEPGNWDKLRAVFHNPEKLKPQTTRQTVTAEAAAKFVTIAERLQHREPDSEAVAHFVNQLVFCFFAEDVGLLPEGFFTRVLKRAAQHPERIGDYLDRLFAAMEEGGEFDLTDIRHFNGGLFDGRRSLKLQPDEIGLLIATADLKWDQIDPTIFGTLFERFLDPEKRAQIGAHYTDTDKIMMIVEPVILRPLRQEWDEARAEIAKIVQRTVGLGTQAYRNAMRKAEERRAQFLERLRTLSILDPACGSGNFLYLALQGVKDLEHRANLECEAMGLSPQTPMVGPEILHGIEINRHAAELARTTIWIGHIQWAIRNGFRSWPSPILKRLETIECRDALIERVVLPRETGEVAGRSPDGGGAPTTAVEAVAPSTAFGGPPPPLRGGGSTRSDFEGGVWREAKWPEAEFIVGNPPFLGGKLMRAGLGDDYVDALFATYAGRVPAEADLVVYWVVKAHEAIRQGRTRRAGLVTTNSIRGGANRQSLDAIVAGGLLFEAWSDEPWIVEGAAVRVSLLCMSDDRVGKRLNGLDVDNINADLSAHAADLTRSKRLPENKSTAFQGPVLVGQFDVPGELARTWLKAPVNPNGKGNEAVLRPLLNGKDINSKPRDYWVIDFSSMSEREAALFEAPFAHALEQIRPYREKNARARRRELWWRHGDIAPKMWGRISGCRRYIVCSQVSKHRVFVWAPTVVWPHQTVIAIARDDDTTFGILHSRFHAAWSLRLGTWLGVGNDPRYTPTTTFETFPFPEGLTPDIPAKDYADDPRAVRIAEVARRLDDLRNAWLNPPDLVEIVPEVVPGYPDRILPKTVEAEKLFKDRTLTKLYNARPQWLADAHADLDRAVAAAYGWPEDISTDDALAKLLELNLARAGAV